MAQKQIVIEPVSEQDSTTWAEDMVCAKEGVCGAIRYFICPECEQRIQQRYTVDWGTGTGKDGCQRSATIFSGVRSDGGYGASLGKGNIDGQYGNFYS